MASSFWIVVLIKDFSTAKSRLAPVLEPQARRLRVDRSRRSGTTARRGHGGGAVPERPEPRGDARPRGGRGARRRVGVAAQLRPAADRRTSPPPAPRTC